MTPIEVNIRRVRDDSYRIYVESGLFSKIPALIAEKVKSPSVWAIISDANVGDIYGGRLLEGMRQAGLDTHLLTFPAGERSKSRKVKAMLEDLIFEMGLGRDGGIVALGGGVTGDLAGFIAATYMRGIPFVQAPTTLLAMVDSSIGGKTGLSVPAGKNLVGAFYQPRAVFIDPALLKTLPAKEHRSGLAEVVKHAVIADKFLFSLLERNTADIIGMEPEILDRVIARNCAVKARVVEKDTLEAGMRQILNYGHTIGHAVEKLSNYRIAHGRAVAIGMAVEGEIARLMKIMPGKDLERQNALLNKLGLGHKIPPKMPPGDIIKAMGMDKKVRGGRIMMALPAGIGKTARGDKGEWTVVPPQSAIKSALQPSRSN